MDYPDYDPRITTDPLADTELDALDALLATLSNDSAMNVEALDGYLTALLLGPRLAANLPGARWLPAIWGGDGDGGPAHPAPFASGKQKKRAVLLTLRHLRSIDAALAETGGQPWEPVFSIADGNDGSERVDAEDWCIGFLIGTALDSDAWAVHWDDTLMAPLVRLGADEAPVDDAERDAVSRSVVAAVEALAARL